MHFLDSSQHLYIFTGLAKTLLNKLLKGSRAPFKD